MSTICLLSSDGKLFDFCVKAAQCCGTIKNMLDECEPPEAGVHTPVPVTAAILEKVIEYCNHHKDDPKLTIDENCEDERSFDISAWDADFLRVDQVTLFHLIMAANFLDARGLLHVTCKTVANMMKGKTAEEIRKTFGIKDDTLDDGDYDDTREE